MNSVLRWIAWFVLACAGTAPSGAKAVEFSSFYVFGDSLVDAGNAFIATGGAQASSTNGYFAGRFSNGPNFADYLAASFGLSDTPALLGGNNYGVGGSLAQFRPGETSPSFLAQIGAFTSVPTRRIAADALVLVTFGGNDVRATTATGGAVSFSGAEADFRSGLSALYGLGARNFVVTGLPDIGLLPSVQPLGAIPGRLDELTARSQQLSGLFAADAAALDLLAGTTVSFFDLFGFEHALLANPTGFGLSPTLNTTTPCQIVGGGVPQLSNCANSLYFDGIHPTTQIHAVIANAIVAQVAGVPEPSTWSALIVGFGLLGGSMRRRRLRVRYA